tara:strand:+ start:1358 stop:2239 length:882 start_codon:yes stop_codon:yes gene_type:complete
MQLNLHYITQLLEYEKPQSGLYIVPTPIGNLSDITIRSLKILSSVDLIICEDTRVTKKLTSKYGINCKMQPFHKFNSKYKTPEVIKKLSSNFSIAITTDSGTPLISDPGADLVKECFENNLSVFSLPGPSAPIASFVLSAFQSENFTFRGFFPRQKKKIENQLFRFNRSDCPEIYFESPKRIMKTLNLILDLSGDCKITFVRELSKKHEEIINTNISNLIEQISLKDKILGEITFIIEPIMNKNNNVSEKEVIKFANSLFKKGLNISEVSRLISKDLSISKRDIYQLLIKNRN